MTRIAIFPGSFDPFTLGHLDTVRRASQLFDQVIIAVMTNAAKKPLFEPEQKVALIEACVGTLENVKVVAKSAKLTVNLADEEGAKYLIRGIRNTNDFEYERDIAALNQVLDQDLETVLLLARPQYAYVSSSMVKEIAAFGGDVTKMVPKVVAEALWQKYQK